MKKIFLYVFLALMWCNISYAKEIEKTSITSELEGAIITKIEPEPYSGHSKKNSDGLSIYYSKKHGKYISCRKFNDEEIEIDYEQQLKELKEDDPYAFLLVGSRSVCHGDEHRGEDGTIEVYDAINNIFIIKPTLSDRFKEHSQSILFVSIGIILIFFLIKFRNKIEKGIDYIGRSITSNSKIKFIKQNKVRVFATLSIVYLCFILWLNWLGHQNPWVIYKMTYTWFLSWGVLPVVVGWGLYFVWRKK